MTDLNAAERIFSDFCASRSIPCERLLESELPMPDFLIRPNGQLVIAEVKEIQRNAEEDQHFEALQTEGIASLSLTPGARVRTKIDAAMPQLRRLAKGHLPSMLVLMNNSGIFQHTEPYAILTAMYGLHTVRLSVPNDPGLSTTVVGDFHGPKRRVTPAHNTTLSALAVMDRIDPGEFELYVYLNEHAAQPLPIKLLSRPSIRQFVSAEDFAGGLRKWIQVWPST